MIIAIQEQKKNYKKANPDPVCHTAVVDIFYAYTSAELSRLGDSVTDVQRVTIIIVQS